MRNVGLFVNDELCLTTRALERHHRVACNLRGDRCAAVASHEMKAQIQSGRGACGSTPAPITVEAHQFPIACNDGTAPGVRSSVKQDALDEGPTISRAPGGRSHSRETLGRRDQSRAADPIPVTEAVVATRMLPDVT